MWVEWLSICMYIFVNAYGCRYRYRYRYRYRNRNIAALRVGGRCVDSPQHLYKGMWRISSYIYIYYMHIDIDMDIDMLTRTFSVVSISIRLRTYYKEEMGCMYIYIYAYAYGYRYRYRYRYARRMGQSTQRATNYTARSNIVTAQIFLHANGQRPKRASNRQRWRRRQARGATHRAQPRSPDIDIDLSPHSVSAVAVSI